MRPVTCAVWLNAVTAAAQAKSASNKTRTNGWLFIWTPVRACENTAPAVVISVLFESCQGGVKTRQFRQQGPRRLRQRRAGLARNQLVSQMADLFGGAENSQDLRSSCGFDYGRHGGRIAR